jgi:2-amino-4-hydroxy-6-hydroxymethyldihydropteridine diphosphokinase
MPGYVVGLGANLGQPRQTFQAVAAVLRRDRRFQVLGAASLYASRAMGRPDQPVFLNTALRLVSCLQPRALLQWCENLERSFGRQGKGLQRPRVLDLDVLLWDGPNLADGRIVLPHPRLYQRRFALLPCCEVAKNSGIAKALAEVEGQAVWKLYHGSGWAKP